MVKADVKHNYYADLEVPTSASVDDIKKQYRKLALQYHPDRNAGKEEEFIPKFQAIQTAHEILCDPATKNKYDVDRRKAGLYPTFGQRPAPTGSPYTATSAYPPPPRRTQPGQWQRPQPTASKPHSRADAGAGPTGADRFNNFPRAAPTARKDPAQDRTNMFRAWQNMNSAQDRQQHFNPSGTSPVPPPVPNRPKPPPRSDTKMPSEDEIRAGMNYRKPPPPKFDADEAETRRSAWASFQQQKTPGKAGMSRSNTTRTPKKQGFDPNAPGSDERPAGFGAYASRHRSEDFGRPQTEQAFPPPPPGPPPMSPLSPSASPLQQRPFADPLRPFRSRTSDDADPQVPYSEGNRVRTPYSSFIGEKTQFNREQSSDSIRRSASTRNATKLSGSGPNIERARSTSPLSRNEPSSDRAQNGPSPPQFNGVNYSDSDESSSSRPTSTSSGHEDDAANVRDPKIAPHMSSPFAARSRPMKNATPPSRRFNGSTNPSNPPPPADGTQSDADSLPGMQQKTSNNMYVNNYPSQHDFTYGAFDTPNPPMATIKRRKMQIPQWAVPPAVKYGHADLKSVAEPVLPGFECGSMQKSYGNSEAMAQSNVDAHHVQAARDEREAYLYFAHQLTIAFGGLPTNFNMDVFLRLASTASFGKTSGHEMVDIAMRQTLSRYPLIVPAPRKRQSPFADQRASHYSFTFPYNHDSSTSSGKSRSEETINTSFSPEGWSGKFTGAPDYFTPPQPTSKKSLSPSRRQKSGLRSATGPAVPPKVATTEGPTQPAASDADQNSAAGAAGAFSFNNQQWEQAFQGPSFAWSPSAAKPPSPTKAPASNTRNRKASRPGAKPGAGETKDQPQVIDEDPPAETGGSTGFPKRGADVGDEGDAMDIDTTPPAGSQEATIDATPTQSASAKEARLYSVPPSTWRQQQQVQTNGRQRAASMRKSGDGNLNTGLDDLAHVEPMSNSNAGGLKDLSGLGSNLPFPSQASRTLPTHPVDPRKLQLPSIPKPPEPPQKVTKESLHNFVLAFNAYLGAYHVFNNTMLQHFTSREHQVQEYLAGGHAWLEAAGTTTGASGTPIGFADYLKNAKEDEQVREAWNVGSELHKEAVEHFDILRERVRSLAAAGTLVDR